MREIVHYVPRDNDDIRQGHRAVLHFVIDHPNLNKSRKRDGQIVYTSTVVEGPYSDGSFLTLNSIYEAVDGSAYAGT